VLTLDHHLKIPAPVSSALIEQSAVLLNKQTNQYFELDEVGARLWELLQQGKSLRESHQVLLGEYAVDPAQLEQDILDLVEDLEKHGLVEVVQP
jgi:hypothetical protein